MATNDEVRAMALSQVNLDHDLASARRDLVLYREGALGATGERHGPYASEQEAREAGLALAMERGSGWRFAILHHRGTR